MSTEQPTQEQKIPSKEELIKVVSEQIELRKLQAELQGYNTQIAVGRANELEAFAKIHHYSQNTSAAAKQPELVNHTVSQADLDNNPELINEGIKVGDEIGIPKDAYEDFIQHSQAKVEDKSPLSVVK